MFVTFYTTKWLNIMATPTALSHVDKPLDTATPHLTLLRGWRNLFPVCLIKPALGCKLWGREKPRPENFCSGTKQFSKFPRQVGRDVKGNTAPQWILGKKEAGLKSAEILSKRRRVKLAWVKIEFQELTIPWAKFRGSGKASKGKLMGPSYQSTVNKPQQPAL